MIRNTGWAFLHEIFHIYLALSFQFASWVKFGYVQQRRSYRRSSDFCVMKYLHKKTYHYVKSRLYEQNVRFRIHCEYSVRLPMLQHKPSVRFRNSSTCASFSLSIKRRADVMSPFFYLSKLSVLTNTGEILNVSYYFGKSHHSQHHQQ